MLTEPPEEYRAWSSPAAILQVAALYTYFLLFDQFAFLHQAKELLETPGDIQRVMAAMGGSGLIFSVVAVGLIRRYGIGTLLKPCWMFCASAALFALLIQDPRFLPLEAAWIGASTGLLTVLVASALRGWLPVQRLGWAIGCGTAIAYTLANIPWVFEGSFERQSILAILLCTVAWFGVPGGTAENDTEPVAGRFPTLPLVLWTLVLMVLVGLDSAVFALIQDRPDIQSLTWGGGWNQIGLACAHAFGAVLAGWLIDRGFRMILAVAAWGIFALAFPVLPVGGPGTTHLGFLYAVGISIYSVLLVAVPSLLPAGETPYRRAGYAAVIFGVAGWIGSALGVGFSQTHDWVSSPFLILVGGLLLLAWCILNRSVLKARAPRLLPASAGLLAGVVWIASTPDPSGHLLEKYEDFEWAESQPIEVRRGKEVYRREGCINCHSQYVRPRSIDAEIYGPYRPIDRSQTPPLVGNRRQGPDLLNAGLRRSAEWHRIHLQNPQLISPGSRMPSYAHLFEKGSTDGEDLVHYLATLGRGHETDFFNHIQAWHPARVSGSEERGTQLFQRHCTPCHGESGAGNGPAASLFSSSPRDLRVGPYGQISLSPPDPLADHLSRVIKFGLPGTSMPGHETMNDEEVADLVQFIRSLQRRGQST